MTEREAVAVFEPRRTAYRSMDSLKQVQAMNALGQTHVIPSALVQPLSSAPGTLRAVFDEIEKWKERQAN
jgi:hypothetical protein